MHTTVGIRPVTTRTAVMPEDSQRLLMTEGTSLSARQTLYALGGRYEIDVIDPSPRCQCRFSRYVRRWRRSPHFAKDPSAFLHFLAEIIKTEQYDVVLPTHEQVYLLSKFRDHITQSTGMALPDFATLKKVQDKASFTRTLWDLNLPVPETTIATTEAELRHNWSYPFYLKLSHSTAGRGVFHITDEEELETRIPLLKGSGHLNGTTEILVQQPAKGVQATVQAVFDRGRMVAIHIVDARQLGVGGMSAARTGANHPIVRQQVEQLGEHLGWHGAMFLDYFYDYDTQLPEYIEGNPRVGETANAWLSGLNLPEQLIRVSLGEQPSPLPPVNAGVRTQSFLMILLTIAYNGGTRRELIRELLQFRFRRGMYVNSQDELTRLSDDYLSIIPMWGVAGQLLLSPRRAKKIVAATIENYALPQSATQAIEALDIAAFEQLFAPHHPGDSA